jgi:transposase InsO family protein
MPWQPRDLMDTKRDFVELALREGANRRALCQRFGISPKCGYGLLRRYAVEGEGAFQPRSRRPLNSPSRSSADIAQAVVAVRQAHPSWGGRKIARRLIDLGHERVPPPSTITAILHRHHLIQPEASLASAHWQRFEHDAPNALWQIDFKGNFATATQQCFPLTLLDDHSRFNLVLQACTQIGIDHVQPHLIQVFQRYGLPVRLNADNGAPWGSPRHPEHGLSQLSVWLIRLGIRVSHSAPYHPQTNGKIERFHRSLETEVLAGRSFSDLCAAQQAFTRWRDIYNHQRPHDALALSTPATRYTPSPRPYQHTLSAIEYPDGDTVVIVKHNGEARFRGHKLQVPKALLKLPIAFRPDPHQDGVFDVYFCHQSFMRLDFSTLSTSN